MKVGVAHPGTQHSWQTAFAFQEANMLGWYATGYYYKQHRFPDKIVQMLPDMYRAGMERELRRRRYDPLNDDLVRRNFGTEFLERFVGKYLSVNLQRDMIDERHCRFPQRLKKIYDREPVDVVWGPHDGLEAFKYMKTLGTKVVLDQPIGHFEALNDVMCNEYEKHPQYFNGKLKPYSISAVERQYDAIDVADHIFVGCDFAAQTLISKGAPASKIHVVEYGYNEGIIDVSPAHVVEILGPVRFIFVGTVDARKGVAYLLDAFRDIDPELATLTIIGEWNIPKAQMDSLPPSVRYLGRVTRGEVAEHLRKADCFVFPTLFEGGGIVLYEAAGCGLPVIQTRNCGIVAVQGETGIIMEHPEELAEAVHTLIENRDVLVYMKNNVRFSEKRRGWSGYRSEIVASLQGICGSQYL